MGEGGERFNPNQLSVYSVIEFLDSQQPEKKLNPEQLTELAVFMNDMFNEYDGKENEWELIYPIPLNEFIKKVGQFFLSQADEKFVVQSEKPLPLMRFTWFQVFRTMR